MITKKQWNILVNRVDNLLNDYDVYVKGIRVEKARDGYILALDRETHTLVKFTHKDSFKMNQYSLSEVEKLFQIKTKPERIMNKNLYEYYRTRIINET